MTTVGVGSLIIMLLSAFLILYKRYPDGFTGRVSLGGLFISGLVVQLAEFVDPARYFGAPLEIKLMIASMIIFLARHVIRVIWFTRHDEVLQFNGRTARPLFRSAK